MPDRAALLAEAERRGILPASLRGEYDQLKASGAITAQSATKAGNTQFDNTTSLRKEFSTRPEVQNFVTVLPQVATAMRLAGNPNATGADDLNIIYTFGKVMDPGSVVREGELALASDTGSFAQSIEGAIEKIKAGDRLPVEVRRNLVESMRKRGVAMSQAYNQTRDNYKAIATRAGIPEEDVIGLHPAEPFQQAEADFKGSPVGNRDGGIGAWPKGQKPSGLPGAPPPSVANDPADFVFNDQDLPQQGSRMSPGNEADFRAFLASKPSAQQIRGRYESYGLGQTLDDANAQKLADYYAQGGKLAPVGDYSKVDKNAQKETLRLKKISDEQGGAPGLKDLIMKGASFNLSDELGGAANAGVNVALSPVTGKFDPSEAYVVGRDVIRMQQAEAEKSYGRAAIPIEMAGGFVGGRPLPGLAAPFTARSAVRSGATLGALAGYGNGEGGADSVGQGMLGGTIGGATGLAAPYLMRGGVNAVGRVSDAYRRAVGGTTRGVEDAALRAQAAPVLQASREEGVHLTQPMVDPRVRNQMAALETKPGSAGVVQRGLRQTTDDLADATGRLAPGGGTNEAGVGDIVQGAGNRLIQRSRGVKNRLYDRAEQLAGDTRILPVSAAQAIRRNVAELSEAGETTNAGLIRYMNELADDLGRDGGVSVQGLRALRTNMRGQISERNLTQTDAERRVRQVLDAASDDLHRGLQRQAPGAAGAYRRADTFNRERQTYIDDVLSRFLGPRDAPISAETAYSRLANMARPRSGDARRLGEMYRSLEPEERATVAATFAESLGRRSPGEDFSPALFVSQARKLSPEARRVIFGPAGARSIDNLARLSQHQTEALNSLNRSRTGVTQNYNEMLKGALGFVSGGGASGLLSGSPAVAVAGAVGGLGAGVSGVAARNVSARMLMSQRFVQWIERAPRNPNPALIAAHINRLSTIAAAEPAIAGEVGALQQRLVSAVQRSPAPAAGQDIDQRRPPVPK